MRRSWGHELEQTVGMASQAEDSYLGRSRQGHLEEMFG